MRGDMLRRALAAGVCIPALLILIGCPRPGRNGTRDDGHGDTGPKFPDKPAIQAKKNPEADAALEQARQTAEVQGREKGVEAYLAVRKAYPETTASQEALYRAGILYFESADYVNARKTFNELLFENPLFDKAQD